MDPPAPAPRGRAALLQKALQMRAARLPGEGEGDAAAAAAPAGVTSPVQEPARPRGRSAMLARMKELAVVRQPGDDEPPAAAATPPVTVSPDKGAIKKIVAGVEEIKVESSEEEEPGSYHFRGNTGTPINVTANYIRLDVERDKGVFEYEVRFEPQVDAKYVRVKILNSQMDKLGGVKLFDGGSCLFLPMRLPDDRTQLMATHPIDQSAALVTVIYKKKKKFGDCTHLLNILFKRIMSTLKYNRVGRHYLDTPSAKMIPQHKLEVIPGYAVAVDEYEGGLMVCLDTMHRVMRTMSVLEYFNDLRSGGPEEFRRQAIANIIGSIVITKYNNKTYIIDDILWDVTPKDTFENQKGQRQTYIEYYKTQYGLNITNTSQPLLLNVKKQKLVNKAEETDINICLVPEFSYLTGLTDAMRADFKVMKDVAVFTRVAPHQRMHSLKVYLDNIKRNPQAQQVLADWGMRMADGTIDLQARILNPEVILFGGGANFQTDYKGDWTGAATRSKVVGPVDLTSWVLMFSSKDERVAKEFADNMVRFANTMGCQIRQPRPYKLQNDRTHSFVQATNEVINDNIQCIVYIVQTQRADLYSAIKRMTLVQHSMATQFVLSRNLLNQKKVRTVTQKIALQINCKLGGSLWAMKIPTSKWMVCGIDVYHSPMSKKSVGALVCSTNENMTKYYTSVVQQERELSDALKVPFMQSLMKFRESTGEYPKQVIMFRDGVGDGQLLHVLVHECKQFEAVLQQLQVTGTHICMIVVQKRIGTRIVSKDQSGNPCPGTVLDHTITRRNFKDFFLVPQAVNQGTVTPTHYVVLQNPGALKENHIQKLTYMMCHMYYNWSGTIRVPAVCQYAHKVAYLVGQHVGGVPGDALNDRLYYL